MHGPVRRGLAGTLLFGISSLGLSWKWVVYVAQLSIYTGTIVLLARVYGMRRREAPWLAIFYSPLFLLFPYYTPEAAFRKEILVFLPLAIFAFSYARQQITGALLWMIPLFAVSIDWGRWVYAYVFGLFTIVLADPVPHPTHARRVPVAVVLLYVISWSIPPCCNYRFGGGLAQQAFDYIRARTG
jgi:hypothetical protein